MKLCQGHTVNLSHNWPETKIKGLKSKEQSCRIIGSKAFGYKTHLRIRKCTTRKKETPHSQKLIYIWKIKCITSTQDSKNSHTSHFSVMYWVKQELLLKHKRIILHNGSTENQIFWLWQMMNVLVQLNIVFTHLFQSDTNSAVRKFWPKNCLIGLTKVTWSLSKDIGCAKNHNSNQSLSV